jgi:hypothetical protein
MYSTEKDGFPQPLIFESESYLGNAEKYLLEKRYDISGNFLRKESEHFCKQFLPERCRLGEYGQLKPLANLLQEAINYCKKGGIDPALVVALDSYRKFLLNDSSHDSFDVPKFKSEIESCIKTIKKLQQIRFESVLKKGDALEFELSTAAGTPAGQAGDYKFEIVIEDDFRLLKEEGKDSVLSHGMINYYVTHNNGAKGELQHGNTSLKAFYDKNYEKSDKAKNVDFWEEVVFSNTGQQLKNIRLF